MVISESSKKPKSRLIQKGLGKGSYKVYLLDYSPSKEKGRNKQFTLGQYRNRFKNFKFNPEVPARKLFLPKGFVKDFAHLFTYKEFLSCICLLGVLKLITSLKDSIHKRATYADIYSYAIKNAITLYRDNASPLLNLMKSLGFLESDGSYQVGVKSTGYRIGPALRDLEWEQFDYDAYFEANVKGRDPRLSADAVILWRRASQYFTTWHDLPEGDAKDICRKTEAIIKKVDIDLDIKLQRKLQNSAEKKELKNLKLGKDSWDKVKLYAGYKAGIDAINSNQIYVTIHHDTQRFFSNITNLKKEARQECSINGERLVSVDIATCQAALLTTLYDANKPADCAEREKYIKLLLEKDIYTEAGGADSNREENKTNFFVLMFAKIWSHKGETFEKVKAQFPILVQRITEMKKNFGYRSVSRLLQRKESAIMIHGVLSELLGEDRDVLSCHDSILCLPKDLERVKECISYHFFRVMNFLPVLKEE